MHARGEIESDVDRAADPETARMHGLHRLIADKRITKHLFIIRSVYLAVREIALRIRNAMH